MSKLFKFYYNFYDKYVPIKSKLFGWTIFILSVVVPTFVPTFTLAYIFPSIPGQIFLVGSMMIWCFTLLPLSLHARRGIESLDFQNEDKRRKTPPNYMFCRYKSVQTDEWTTWNRMDMNDEYWKEWYKNFIQPLVAIGEAEVEFGGETEEQKKIRIRKTALENILEKN